MNRMVVKSSEVLGVEVKSMEREKLGHINDMVIDKASGRVNYLVLDFGGFLSFGNKFFAIPWALFTYDTVEDCFLTKLDKDQLKNAPGFDKGHWPNFADPVFIGTLEKYYR